MLIEYDDYLKSWVVWQKQGPIQVYCFEAKTKRECEEYIKKNKKKGQKKFKHEL